VASSIVVGGKRKRRTKAQMAKARAEIEKVQLLKNQQLRIQHQEQMLRIAQNNQEHVQSSTMEASDSSSSSSSSSGSGGSSNSVLDAVSAVSGINLGGHVKVGLPPSLLLASSLSSTNHLASDDSVIPSVLPNVIPSAIPSVIPSVDGVVDSVIDGVDGGVRKETAVQVEAVSVQSTPTSVAAASSTTTASNASAPSSANASVSVSSARVGTKSLKKVVLRKDRVMTCLDNPW